MVTEDEGCRNWEDTGKIECEGSDSSPNTDAVPTTVTGKPGRCDRARSSRSKWMANCPITFRRTGLEGCLAEVMGATALVKVLGCEGEGSLVVTAKGDLIEPMEDIPVGWSFVTLAPIAESLIAFTGSAVRSQR